MTKSLILYEDTEFFLDSFFFCSPVRELQILEHPVEYHVIIEGAELNVVSLWTSAR